MDLSRRRRPAEAETPRTADDQTGRISRTLPPPVVLGTIALALTALLYLVFVLLVDPTARR